MCGVWCSWQRVHGASAKKKCVKVCRQLLAPEVESTHNSSCGVRARVRGKVRGRGRVPAIVDHGALVVHKTASDSVGFVLPCSVAF